MIDLTATYQTLFILSSYKVSLKSEGNNSIITAIHIFANLNEYGNYLREFESYNFQFSVQIYI